MKKLKLYILSGIATLMLTACPKDPVVEPVTEGEEVVDPKPSGDDNPDDSSEGTGIDDLHGSQTDKPAYSKQR